MWMLADLSKKDRKWRGIAFYICRDRDLADDLTNDMYLKMHDCGRRFCEINEWYVYITIKNLYLHHIRRANRDQGIVQAVSEFAEADPLDDRKMMNHALNELNVFDREILLQTSERSLRKAAKYLNQLSDGDGEPKKVFSARSLHYMKHNALEKLRETETIKNEKTKR